MDWIMIKLHEIYQHVKQFSMEELKQLLNQYCIFHFFLSGSDDESEDESDDESDWSESEEESDSEAGGYDLDICPPQCDQALYDNTCALREKRLDFEEALTEERKMRDTFVKDLDSLTKKARVIEHALKQAENELEAFQVGWSCDWEFNSMSSLL